MNNVIRLAIVDPVDDSRDKLKTKLLGIERIWLEAECSRYEFFADVVNQTEPEMALVALDKNPDQAVRLIAELQEKCPKCSVVALSGSNDGNLILKAIRAGAREFLTQPVQIEDLLVALDRIREQFHGGSSSSSSGSMVITIAGATGGVGSTSVAVNLACYLARDPSRSVAVVDLDLTLGDADVLLDTIPEYTLVDVAQNAARLDFTLLKKSLTKHSSGVFLLPRPTNLHDVDLVTPEDLQRVLGLLKATFTHLVIDTSKSFSPLDRVALDAATHVLLISQLDLPCLRNVVRLMSSFREIDNLEQKVKILVNRAGLNQGQISLKKAQETLGREIFWQLPNDYQSMVAARNNGVPLMESCPKSPLAQSMDLLAQMLVGGGDKASAPQAGKGSLSRLFGGILSKKDAPPAPAKPAAR